MGKPISSSAEILKELSRKGIKDGGKVLNDTYLGNGTGSFILDFLTRGKVGNSKSYKNIQRKLFELDLKAGEKAYNFFDKRKSKKINAFKNGFVREDFFKVPNGNSEYLKVKTPGISNPLAKTKDKVFPLVGSFTVANHLFKEKEGDDEQHE